MLIQCLAAFAADSTATERERAQYTQRCEDIGYWYVALEEMLGPSGDEGTHATMQDRFEVLAARAFADALISEGQLARILATDRIAAVRIATSRLRDL